MIGGAGADMLGSLLGSAGPILNGVASIIAASKSGGAQQGADPSQAAAAQQAAPQQAAPPGADAAAAAQQAASPGFVPHHRPRVSVTVKSF
ncbi:MAG TPA: hypothetical protein VFQ65_10225 [Kofleriaceae bacterium]|nr:hypothetical protein [Kofleriaceae bacterium]